jgi:hypothetical protein
MIDQSKIINKTFKQYADKVNSKISRPTFKNYSMWSLILSCNMFIKKEKKIISKLMVFMNLLMKLSFNKNTFSSMLRKLPWEIKLHKSGLTVSTNTRMIDSNDTHILNKDWISQLSEWCIFELEY